MLLEYYKFVGSSIDSVKPFDLYVIRMECQNWIIGWLYESRFGINYFISLLDSLSFASAYSLLYHPVE